MASQVHAIPTKYNGIQMRSRLEARWAAFFDELGWRWEYEPCDFRGWIPDFAIIGGESLTYVEIKPVVQFPATIAQEIEQSGMEGEALILGLSPFHGNGSETGGQYREYLYLGWLLDKWEIDDLPTLFGDPAMFGQWRGTAAGGVALGFCAEQGSWKNRISGVYTGDDFISGVQIVQDVRDAWAHAINSTQWASPVRQQRTVLSPVRAYERYMERALAWAQLQTKNDIYDRTPEGAVDGITWECIELLERYKHEVEAVEAFL